MKKRNILIGAAAATVLVFALGGVILAEVGQGDCGMMGMQGPGFGRHMMGMRAHGWMALGDDLNLTDEQHAQLKEIKQRAHNSEMRAEMADVFESSLELRKAVTAETANEAAIRKAADDLGAAIGDAAVLASGFAGEARDVLTPEQIETLEAFAAERESRIDTLMDRKGS